MANLVYCEDNILLKNNYYFAQSTLNVSNPTKIPTNHTGIADSGANGFYFTPDALVDDYDPTAPTVGVRVANGNPARSVARVTLASVPALPPGMLCHHLPTPSLGWDHLQTKVARSTSQRLQSQSIILTATLSSPDGVI
jgi:hypothetical protein